MENRQFSLAALQVAVTLALTGVGVSLLYVVADYATQGVLA